MVDDLYFHTSYRPEMFVYRKGERPPYGCGVWARDADEAALLVKERNLPGEELEDALPSPGHFDHPAHIYVMSALIDKKSRNKFNVALHALTFLCYLASCSGTTSAEIVGDGGVLHEFVHVMTAAPLFPNEFEYVMIAVLELELRVPGYLNRFRKEHASRYKNSLQERIARST